MKKVLNVLFIICFIFNSTATFADDLTPADVYYRDNIAVNEISAKSPRIDDEDEPDPEDGPPTGGIGDGEFVGGPLEDAILPIVIAGLAYVFFILNKRKSTKTV